MEFELLEQFCIVRTGLNGETISFGRVRQSVILTVNLRKIRYYFSLILS